MEITAQAAFTKVVFGRVTFTQEEYTSPVNVSIKLYDVPDGVHGIHIHSESGHFSLETPWSPETPWGIPHGDHTGDMCHNVTSIAGTVDYQYTDHLISLQEGDPANVVGMTVVLHEKSDDMGIVEYEEPELMEKSKISGNAGEKLATATIKYIDG
jgi:Cu/Zn superoxide dismutase